MKKKVLSGLFALALLVATGYGVNQSMKSETGLSDLALMNVEALAQNEYPEFWTYCAGSWDAKKCVCGSRAFTWAVAVANPCYTTSM